MLSEMIIESYQYCHKVSILKKNVLPGFGVTKYSEHGTTVDNILYWWPGLYYSTKPGLLLNFSHKIVDSKLDLYRNFGQEFHLKPYKDCTIFVRF